MVKVNVPFRGAASSFFSEAQRNGVFAFIDFKAWNGVYGAGDGRRKFTYSQTASAADANLVKSEINERVFPVFFLYCNLYEYQRGVFITIIRVLVGDWWFI